MEVSGWRIIDHLGHRGWIRGGKVLIEPMNGGGNGWKQGLFRLRGSHDEVKRSRGVLVERNVDHLAARGVQWAFLDVIDFADDLNGFFSALVRKVLANGIFAGKQLLGE